MQGTKWIVVRESEQPPKIVEIGRGRFQDERRTVCTMLDNSILSHEYADEIVSAINEKE